MLLSEINDRINEMVIYLVKSGDWSNYLSDEPKNGL